MLLVGVYLNVQVRIEFLFYLFKGQNHVWRDHFSQPSVIQEHNRLFGYIEKTHFLGYKMIPIDDTMDDKINYKHEYCVLRNTIREQCKLMKTTHRIFFLAHQRRKLWTSRGRFCSPRSFLISIMLISYIILFVFYGAALILLLAEVIPLQGHWWMMFYFPIAHACISALMILVFDITCNTFVPYPFRQWLNDCLLKGTLKKKLPIVENYPYYCFQEYSCEDLWIMARLHLLWIPVLVFLIGIKMLVLPNLAVWRFFMIPVYVLMILSLIDIFYEFVRLAKTGPISSWGYFRRFFPLTYPCIIAKYVCISATLGMIAETVDGRLEISWVIILSPLHLVIFLTNAQIIFFAFYLAFRSFIDLMDLIARLMLVISMSWWVTVTGWMINGFIVLLSMKLNGLQFEWFIVGIPLLGTFVMGIASVIGGLALLPLIIQ